MVDRYSRSGAAITPQETKPNEYWGGNIRGIIAHLDDLKDIGITTLLLTPVTDSESYHGYHVIDLMAINPHFGTLSDYQNLIEECHKRDIRILFDFVANHTSKRSPLYLTHPDWYRPQILPDSINDTVNVEKWPRISFYDLPDLMQEKEEVYQHLLRAAAFWIEQGVDGFRMDAVTLIGPSFWRRFNADIRKIAPKDFFIIGEVFSTDTEQLNAYEGFFDAVFDFRFHGAIGHGWSDYTLIAPIEDPWTKPDRPVLRVRMADNHDVPRLTSVCKSGNDCPAAYLVMGFVMLSPGIPTILYGTEAGLLDISTNGEFDSSRTAMKFEKIKEGKMYGFLKKMAALRKEFDFNTPHRRWVAGNGLTPLVIGFYSDPAIKKKIFVMMNFSDAPQKWAVDLRGLAPDLKSSTTTDYITGQKLEIENGRVKVNLGQFGIMVLRAE